MSTPLPQEIPLPQLNQQTLTVRNVTDRMPVEILAYIFQFYIDLSVNATRGVGVPPEDVLPLGAVCQRWRKIAWESPHLWNNPLFKIKPRSTTAAQMVQLAIEWLGRSGNRPLSINIFGPLEPGPLEPELQQDLQIFAPLADAICEVLHRCQKLILSGLSTSMLARISAERPFDSPCLLRELGIYCILEDLSDPLAVINFGNAAPLSLTLELFKLDRFSIDWSNLTEFVSSYLSLNDTFKVLTLAPRLVKLRLFIYSNDVVQEIPNGTLAGTTSLRCANLQNLYIDAYSEDPDSSAANTPIVSAFLRNLILPNLTIFGVQHAPPFPAEDFLDLVDRSRCTITELSLNYGCISVDDLVLLAESLTSVTSFFFHLKPTDSDSAWGQMAHLEDLLEAFCLDDQFHDLSSEDDVLFPNLKHIFVASGAMPLPLELLPRLKLRHCYMAAQVGKYSP
ncbi:hypothetical protein JR316_0000228 [Psilocybe cubensis]|uniref:Uncharacterized protein n=2 Tax=Psilocybe cubensis TaxID=181762 RepID=A0ACB8HEP0_PSICU|nr:hypothetical protein JR316_0000228 [Psilocybe cubensis]KAH9486164.1 hypothetical protein JR316_0000228 [Psilocybe cubensis]